MLNLITNLRLNKIKNFEGYSFKSDLKNFSTSELELTKEKDSNILPSQIWLEIYRCQ